VVCSRVVTHFFFNIVELPMDKHRKLIIIIFDRKSTESEYDNLLISVVFEIHKRLVSL
jgi:hypothetical protein